MKKLLIVLFIGIQSFALYSEDNETEPAKPYDVYDYLKCIIIKEDNAAKVNCKNIDCEDLPKELYKCGSIKVKKIDKLKEIYPKPSYRILLSYYINNKIEIEHNEIKKIKNLLSPKKTENSSNNKKENNEIKQETFLDKSENLYILIISTAVSFVFSIIALLIAVLKGGSNKEEKSKPTTLADRLSQSQIKEVEKLINESQVLITIREDIKEINQKLQEQPRHSQQPERQPQINTYSEETARKILYAATPENGKFINISERDNGDSSYCYRLEAMNDTYAYYTIVPNKRVLRSPDSYVDPGCDVMSGKGSAEINNVVIIRKGQATFTGGKWTIKTKAQVRYE